MTAARAIAFVAATWLFLLVEASVASLLPWHGVAPELALLVVLYIGFSMVTLGHSSWAVALVPEYHQRSRIYGWMQAMGVVAIVTVLAIPGILHKVWNVDVPGGVQGMGWFIIGITPLTIFLCAVLVGEPRLSEKSQRITLKDYGTMLARASLLRILVADLFLALGPGPKTDKILGGSPQQPVAAPQGVADVGLVEERETTGELDALRGATKVVDGLHGFRTDGDRLAERAPWLEVIGVKVGEPADLSPAQALGDLGYKGRKRRH